MLKQNQRAEIEFALDRWRTGNYDCDYFKISSAHEDETENQAEYLSEGD